MIAHYSIVHEKIDQTRNETLDVNRIRSKHDYLFSVLFGDSDGLTVLIVREAKARTEPRRMKKK